VTRSPSSLLHASDFSSLHVLSFTQEVAFEKASWHGPPAFEKLVEQFFWSVVIPDALTMPHPTNVDKKTWHCSSMLPPQLVTANASRAIWRALRQAVRHPACLRDTGRMGRGGALVLASQDPLGCSTSKLFLPMR
jgi:hypothetical protein